ICAGFGLMTFLAAFIFEIIIGKVLKLKGELEQWTFGKWILYNLGAMLVISLANFLFARILIIGFIDWSLLPQMVYGTFMVGIIPITVLGGISILVQERKYQNIAKDINQHKTSVRGLKTNEDRTLFEIPLNRVKYIESLQNYVYIGHLDNDGQFKKITERATIKNIEEATSGSPVVKSHRSFLVNVNDIINISGNAQGLLLELSDCDRSIPVSRSYVDLFKSK
ncbi:MAG: LytTR family DNA-binding domain-containing protein, partial [Cyclobacteriaceae bacterium]